MLKKLFIITYFLTSYIVNSQNNEFVSMEIAVDPFTTGTLLAPEDTDPVPLVILIQDSGGTDQDGNQPYNVNNASKLLAQALAKNNIATYRFNKRVLKMKRLGLKEEDIRFSDFVRDLSSIVDFFAPQERFTKIILLGHGEGSLTGMLAAQKNVDAFISVGGAGQPIHEIILTQIEQQIPGLKENAENAFNEMLETGKTQNYNSVLENIFKPSAQAFMLSWMKLNPAEEIKKLDIPVLIVHGTKDIQMPPDQAQKLQEAKPDADFALIKDMNHIMKIIEGGDMENAKSFNEAWRPIAPQLVERITTFIKTKI